MKERKSVRGRRRRDSFLRPPRARSNAARNRELAKKSRSRRTCCAMRVGRSASASSVASSSEVSDAALHRNAWTGRPGMWRAPRPERRALAGARARVAAARRFGRSMRDVACMSTGEIEPKGRRRAWGCGGELGRHAFLLDVRDMSRGRQIPTGQKSGIFSRLSCRTSSRAF